MANHFATNLKYLRECKKLSQNKLAEKVGVNQTTIARWESEEIKPSIDNVEQIAKTLDVALPDLLISDLRFNNDDAISEDDVNNAFELLTENDDVEEIVLDNGIRVIKDKNTPLTAEKVIEINKILMDALDEDKK